MTPELLFSVAVGVVVLAVALVVFGLGYLLGRRVATRVAVGGLATYPQKSMSDDHLRGEFTVPKKLVKSR